MCVEETASAAVAECVAARETKPTPSPSSGESYEAVRKAGAPVSQSHKDKNHMD